MLSDQSLDSFESVWDLVDYYLGPLRTFIHEPEITEICVNRFDEIFVERKGSMVATDCHFESEQALVTLVTQIANALGQVCCAQTHPILDARLQDGSRICAVLYPIAPRGTTLSIRTFPKQVLKVEELLAQGAINDDLFEYFQQAVRAKANILVSGGTGSGKTTLLNCLAQFIPAEERVITVEDTQELQLEIANRVHLEAPRRRKAESDSQEINLAQLIKTTLRLRPTRIIVGEIRDGHAAEAFLQAINTGHNGAFSTIHANSAEDALWRMITLVLAQSRLPLEVVKRQIYSNIDVLIHTQWISGIGRRIVEVCEVKQGVLTVLWRRNHHNTVLEQLNKNSKFEENSSSLTTGLAHFDQ